MPHLAGGRGTHEPLRAGLLPLRGGGDEARSASPQLLLMLLLRGAGGGRGRRHARSGRRQLHGGRSGYATRLRAAAVGLGRPGARAA
jgi:hypothetical protein